MKAAFPVLHDMNKLPGDLACLEVYPDPPYMVVELFFVSLFFLFFSWLLLELWFFEL